jgi:hypothetical protein
MVRSFLPEVTQPGFSQRDTGAGPSHNNVVKHLDADDLAGTDQLPGYFDILRRWHRLSGRMVMREYDT